MLGGKEQPLFRLDAEAVPKGQQGHCGVAVVLAHPHRCIGRVGSQRSGDRDIVYKVNERARIVEPQPTAAHAGLSDEELVTGIGEALATVRKQMRDEISKLREDHERLRAQIEAANVVSIGRGRSDAGDAETRLNDALAGVPPRDRTTALITSIIADGQHDETACTCMVLIQVGVRMARTLPLDERAPISTLMSEELKALGVCWH